MSQFDSDTYDNQELAIAKAGKQIADSVHISGKPRMLQVKWTVGAGVTTGDTIRLAKIPNGASIAAGSIDQVVSAAAGAGSHKLGTSADDDALSAAVNLNTAGAAKMATTVTDNFKSESFQDLILTVGADVTAGRVILFNIPLLYGE